MEKDRETILREDIDRALGKIHVLKGQIAALEAARHEDVSEAEPDGEAAAGDDRA